MVKSLFSDWLAEYKIAGIIGAIDGGHLTPASLTSPMSVLGSIDWRPAQLQFKELVDF